MKTNITISGPERDAILAGLRLLQCGLDRREGYYAVSPNDGDVGDILTNSGEHPGMTAEEIDGLCDLINR